MAQANIKIPDSSPAQFRAAINAANQALASQSAGPTAPPNPLEGQLWRDTSGSQEVLRVYESGEWKTTSFGSQGPPGPPGPNITDAELGDKAFSNPPNDLSFAEKANVRTAIDAGSALWAREGILERTESTDQSIQDTLRLNENNVPGEITTGAKFYISGGDVGGLKGKVIRRTGVSISGVSQADFRANFSKWWEVILETSGGSRDGEITQAIDDLERKTQDLSVFAPASTGWSNATQSSQGGFFTSGSTQTFSQAKALNDNQFVVVKTSGVGKHILARIPVGTDPAQYRIEFRSGHGVHQYRPTLNTYRNIGSDNNWIYLVYGNRLGDDVATLTLQVTASADHIGHTEFRGTLGDGIVTTDAIKDDAVNEDKLADDAVGTDNIKDGAITQDKLDSNINLGGGLSTVETDDTIEGDGSSADPLKITWRDEVRKNTDASSRLKLATADIIVGETRDPSWGIVNISGAAGGIAKNNGDGYWNLTRAKAATYTSAEVTASGNGDYFVARLPLGSDTRLYAFREAGTFSGTIDEPLNAARLLGSDNSWDYYIYDVRLFGTVSLRSSTHNVGFNRWAGKLADGTVDTDSIKDGAVTSDKLAPAIDDAITKNTTDTDRLKIATHDIIVGEHRNFSWGKVNSSGAEGGLTYAENFTLETAKAATYSAPDITLPNGGSFVCIRIPIGTDPRNYFIREPSRIFGNIDAHLNEITRLGADDNWQYYWERVRWFGDISLEASSHSVGTNLWAGRLGDQPLTQVRNFLSDSGISTQAYSTIMKAGSSTALAGSWVDLTLADTPLVDVGTFSKSGSELTVGVAGQYMITAQASATTNGSSSSSRVRIGVRIAVTRAADTTIETSVAGSNYIRAQYNDLYTGIANVSQVFGLQAGDKVKVQAIAYKQSAGDSVTLNVAQCSLNVALSGGATGERGERGLPGSSTIGDGSLTTAKIQDRAITADKLANASVIGRTIDAEAVTEEKIAANAVTTAKIKDGSITQAKLDSNISLGVSEGAVGTFQLADYAVTNTKLSEALQTKIRQNTDETTRLKAKTADILTGTKRITSWGDVNSNGADGGIAYAESWTLETAKAATYSAPSLTSPSGGAYYAARIPAGAEPRNYAIREPSSLFGPIDIHLNDFHFLGTDDTWDYYEDHARVFGDIHLRSSSHTVGTTKWSGGYADGSIDIDALADAIVARLIPTGGTEGQVLTPSGWGDFEGGRLTFEQVGQDADVDYTTSLQDTTIDIPTVEGLYGIAFTEHGRIHTFSLSGLNGKASSASNRSPVEFNSYSFDNDAGSSTIRYGLGRNATTKKLTVSYGAPVQDQTVTLYLIAAT